jgi:TM2 domain-containing membrane protein YozV
MTDQIVCPYCRMPFDDQGPPRIFCTACGMPHHEDCYQENGGCTVFGCPQAPADDPKVHVSYSDLQMTPAAAVVQTPVITPVTTAQPQYLSRYGSGPLGLAASAASAPALQATPASSNGNLVSAQAAAASPAMASPAVLRQPKSRTTYIMLGVLLGAVGAHNFYAGYTSRAVGQLCLSMLTLFYLAIVSWIWAIVEICVVDRDSAGIEFS